MRLVKDKPIGRQGFTLIELLVVITLIGILAIAVLSALNPIEQINKARDARKRADSAQLLKAIDRYFASSEKFPWNNYTLYTSVDDIFGNPSEVSGVGVCDTAAGGPGGDEDTTTDVGGCANDGVLITTQELKAQFGKRDYFKSTALETDKLQVFKEAADPSVSICYIPASKATRDTAGDTGTALKTLTFGGTGGTVSAIAECSTAPLATEWAAVGTACFVCVPEE